MSKKQDKAPEPMDNSVVERAVGEAAQTRPRTAYGLETLVDEVLALFPETPVEFTGFDGRKVAVDATFDFTSLDDTDRENAVALLLVTTDVRIKAINHEEGVVLVEFFRNARIQDSRDPFGLDDAWMVLTEGEGSL